MKHYITRSTPYMGRVTVRRFKKNERNDLLDKCVGSLDAPTHVADKGWNWLVNFCNGREWAMSHAHPDAPTVSKGAAFWSGYRYEVLRQGEAAFPILGQFITDSQDIAGVLDDIPLSSRQWQYFTGFSGPDDVTALIVDLWEGEYGYVWATSSSAPWSTHSWEPLPVRYK